MTNRIEAQARVKGLRLTGQRKLIAQVIACAHDHPDVPELHRRVAARDDRVSLATVYRTMKRFEELGLIERHEFWDGRARYEPSAKRHHDHLIDIDTREVVEFRSEEIERLQAACQCNPEMAPAVQSRNDTPGLNPAGEGAPAELGGVAPPGRLTAS